MTNRMGRYRQGLAALALLSWATTFALLVPAVPLAGEKPPLPEAPRSSLPGGFDRQAVERELARSPGSLQTESSQGLRAYLSRLDQIRSALEAAPDISASERRTLSDHLLARMVEVGLMLRQRAPGQMGGTGLAGKPKAGAHLFLGMDVAGILADNSLFMIGLLGGLVVAFALGSLVGYRRGTRQATYYGEGDPRIRFLTRASSRPAEQGRLPPITLARMREALAAGRPVQLQLEYEIAPSRRPRFLELIRQAQQLMQGVHGQRYTVWEDSRHPNRFSEVLVCRQASALALLTDPDGPLARIGEEIEKCRVRGGVMVRRVWWEVSCEAEESAGPAPAAEDSMEREMGE